MQPCDTLIAPEWCVPIEPAGVILDDHAVVIRDGRILDLLPAAEARTRYRPGSLIERPGHVLLPGLINAHTHAAMSLFRGIADDLPLEAWLRENIWPAERRWVSREMVRDGTELAIAEMLLAGVTCFADQYYFPEIVAETAVDLHMRAVIGTPVVDFDMAWASGADECLSKGVELVHDPYAEHPLVSTCFAPHSTRSLPDEAFKALRVQADQLDLPVQIHLHETRAEIEQSLAATGMRPLDRLAALGLVNPSLLIVHGVHVTDAEIERIAAAGVGVVSCPRSNLKLASGVAPLSAYRAAGVNVAIGTDGPASNNVLDVLDELRLAALLGKGISGDAAAIDAGAALRMATIDAAAALGLAERCGSIVPGKLADLACVDLNQPNSQPVYDPVSQLVYTARADQVSDVWVAGRQRVDAGSLTATDMDALLARCAEWRQRMGRKLGRPPHSAQAAPLT